jgi:galactokinase
MNEQSISDKFRQIFACNPEIISTAPGRVNLIGDHTDYNEGFVLPAAINMHATIAACRRKDLEVHTFAQGFTQPLDHFSLDNIEICTEQTWPNYIRGTIKCLRHVNKNFSGINLLISGDVPHGAGLSSSASLEIALLRAISKLYELNLEGVEAAVIGQKAENTFVGCNCGIMDQLISALGLKDNAMLLDCREITYKDIPLPEGSAILVVNSNVKRELVDSEYNERRKQCESAIKILNISSLRDLNLQHLYKYKELLSDEQFRRARHVVTENKRTIDAAKAMRENDLKLLGQLMAESHASLRDDYEVSTKELDFLVDTISTQVDGAGGVRMTGGGFGGCVVSIMPKEKIPSVISKVKSDYSEFSGIEADFYQCTASLGAFRSTTRE